MVIFTMLMKPEILAICEKRTEQQAYEDAFTFNSSRQNLSAYDQGHYITEVLMKLFPEVYRTQDDIGKRLSLEQSTVSKILTAYRELETQVAKLSSENMTRVINLPERTINKISKAPEALKPAIFEQVVEKDLSVRETEKLVKEVNAVPEAEVDDKTVEDKVSALFDEADKTLSKAERANNKLLEGAVVLTPEPIVLEVICRAGESKITVEQLKVFLSFYLQKLYDFAKASGKLDQVFEDAQLEAAKW
jgi:ParB family chromosome partitioning protein